MTCVVETVTVGLFMGECAGVAARRQCDWRLRCHWRHEELSIRTAGAAAMHHSVQRHPLLMCLRKNLGEFEMVPDAHCVTLSKRASTQYYSCSPEPRSVEQSVDVPTPC